MKDGLRNKYVSLQKPVRIVNPDTGERINTWQEEAKLWVEIVPSSVREFDADSAEQVESTGRIVIRYRPNVTNKHRIVHNGLIYNITGVLPDPFSGKDYLTLPYTQGINNG